MALGPRALRGQDLSGWPDLQVRLFGRYCARVSHAVDRWCWARFSGPTWGPVRGVLSLALRARGLKNQPPGARSAP